MKKRITGLPLLVSIFPLLMSLPLGADVIFERQVPPEILERYEVVVSGGYPDKGITKDELQKLVEDAKARAQKDKTTLKIELLYDAKEDNRPYFLNTHLGRDKVKEARSLAWWREASERLALKKSVGGTKPNGIINGGLSDHGYVFFEDLPEFGYIWEQFRGPEGQFVSAFIDDIPQRVIDDHQFLRSIIKEDCKLEKKSFGYAVASRDRWGKTSERGKGENVSWLHGEHLKIAVDAVGRLPQDLVEEYGKKFPSTLPEDFKIDKDAWGREEARYWLRRMEKALSKDDPGEPQDTYAFFIATFNEYIFVPQLSGVVMWEASLEAKKRQFELLSGWWKENEEKTYWHETLQMLVARGKSPEDLERAEREKEEKRVQAILDEPMTEERVAVLRRRLVEQFEKEMGDQHVRMQKARNSEVVRFEKEGEKKWVLSIESPRTGVTQRRTYTGPVVRKRLFHRKQPLEAKIKEEFSEQPGGETGEAERRYVYDVLRDRWMRN